ncbi:DEAD/DEAH box helicase [Aquitalea sp. LB_tupeE]|uniref:DEAD/DEAH box helicase n=1 Tax=Aquitalea sp. LB_tupeE TaxID=2748078 RepID=UPI0015C1B4F5|nr:DEAD/DEAH box helicase [Aquitalea sp. LB_tupeE]NWK77741.1 DEAD/DEAH box helicase [Aquitalea sp. LB_tupeE]
MQTTTSQRLAWRILANEAGIRLTPCIQQLEGAGWSRGRVLPLGRLLDQAGQWDWLSTQDRLVIRQLERTHQLSDGSSLAELEGEAALPLLLGHPALFWEEQPDQPVTLEAGQISLLLQRQQQQMVLQLSPPGIAACQHCLWQRSGPNSLLVYWPGAEIRQLAALLGHRLSVPVAARKKLLEAIGDMVPWLPVELVEADDGADLPAMPADPRLFAVLTPLPEGLRLQLRCRVAEQAAWYPPGRGPWQQVALYQGQALRFQRQLSEEKQALAALLDDCPALAAARPDPDGVLQWLLANQQQALQVVQQLQAIAPQRLECVWPQGQRMRIQAQAGLPQLRLKTKRKNGWLEVTGEVQVDEDRVLQLRQLLEALAHQPGQYLRLSEQDWLVLSDSLHAKLQQLVRLADHAIADGLRLSLLAAPLLAVLSEDIGQFDGDAGWQQLQQGWDSLRTFEPSVPATLQASLRPYQLQGFAWLSRLAHIGAGACLADDMGLGKTVQTLALLLARAHLGPQLVVAPTSVALNWLAEAARFAPSLHLRPYQQQRDLSTVGPQDLVIASYGLLQLQADDFAEVHWASVVLDEAQAIKNAATKRAQAAQGLRADFRLAASGTPVENHLGELWSLFRFITPGLLGNEERFQQRFAQPIAEGDEQARTTLKAMIQPYLLRRTKAEVLTELPPRTDITRRIALSEQEVHVYEAMRQQALQTLAEVDSQDKKTMQVLAELTRLRRFCCHPALLQPDTALPASKFAFFCQLMSELLDNGHKALVFSQFVDHLALARQWLDEQGIAYQYLDGATPGKQRKARMDAFQAGEGEVFLISLKAGGTGLNLTAADYVIHLDPWWNPAVEDQASDRAYRMGQQRPVTVYRLVAENTIEEKIVALHAEKRALADSLLEGGDLAARLDGEALLALLQGS